MEPARAGSRHDVILSDYREQDQGLDEEPAMDCSLPSPGISSSGQVQRNARAADHSQHNEGDPAAQFAHRSLLNRQKSPTGG